MTTKDALQRFRQKLYASSAIRVMDEKKVQVLMSKPSASFIRYYKPIKESQLKPKTSK